MFFKQDATISEIFSWAQDQITAVRPVSKHGIIVDIKPYKKPRSNEQNRFLMVIMQELVRFYHETGYVVPGLPNYLMRAEVLKEYFKGRYGIESTKNLDTAEFTKFIDWVQTTLVEETNGEWEILTTDSAYLKGLLKS
jgi:hypothetical protein